jgi:hypothetical protein
VIVVVDRLRLLWRVQVGLRVFRDPAHRRHECRSSPSRLVYNGDGIFAIFTPHAKSLTTHDEESSETTRGILTAQRRILATILRSSTDCHRHVVPSIR